jgi:ATP-binding cassette, subfamily B, bacterial PglK
LPKISSSLSQLLYLFNKREKIELFGIFLLSLIIAILEMVGVGLILPFIGVITKPGIIHENSTLRSIYDILPVNSEWQFFIWFAFGLVAFIVAKNSIYAAVIYVQQNYLIGKRVYFTTLLYQDYLNRPYSFHLNNNSAMLLRNINQVDGIFSGILQPFFLIMTEALTIVCIICLLFYTNGFATLGAIILVLLPAYYIQMFLGRRFQKLGEGNFKFMAITSKLILEGLNGIKELKVMNRWKLFCVDFAKNALELGHIRRDQQLLNQAPRLILEVIIMGCFMSVIIYLLWQKHTVTDEILPVIALFGAASLRVMPSINKVISGFNQLEFSKILQSTICVDLIESKRKDIDSQFDETSTYSKSEFEHSIKLQSLSYRYQETEQDAVHNISLEIPRGSSVGFVGHSGAGKSTLVDMILGLLPPDRGEVLFDGRDIQQHKAEWRRCIGYIPQEIFLCDDTLRRNIAFGIPDQFIDESSLAKVIKIGHLESVLDQLPKGLDTILGERGVRLSGGERQRIAIARALYHDPSVVLMDEATSALDGETEIEITRAIEELRGDKTLIIVAHRLSTVKKCDCVYFLVNGEIRDSGKVEDLLAENPEYRKMAGLENGWIE